MKEGSGEYKYEAGAHKPEYETLAMFGSSCLNCNLESIIKVNDICNRYGLDTISTGAVIAMAIECYANGIISKEDTGGLEMSWGNHQAIVAMTERIAKREGFGAVLADGAKVAAERIGQGADQFAMHIQGQELPAHNPRFGFHWALGYRMDPTPARHTQGPGRTPRGLPIPEYDRNSQSGMQPGYKLAHSFSHVVHSLGLCIFVYWALPHIGPLMESLKRSPAEVTFDELFKTGERINMRQAFNVREGLNALRFHIPSRILGIPRKKALKGITLDEEAIDGEYLAAMNRTRNGQTWQDQKRG